MVHNLEYQGGSLPLRHKKRRRKWAATIVEILFVALLHGLNAPTADRFFGIIVAGFGYLVFMA